MVKHFLILNNQFDHLNTNNIKQLKPLFEAFFLSLYYGFKTTKTLI